MKTFFNYSWIFIILFFILGVIDSRFGLLAIICMASPIFFALKGDGRKGCNMYCPRGSLLNKLSSISFKKTAPKWIFNNTTKFAVFTAIMAVFVYGTYMAWGDFYAIGFVFIRMVLISSVLALILGIFYKERTWCGICPMGSLANVINNIKKNKGVNYL